MNKIRVLIADDHPVFRFGMRVLIESEDEFEVVGEASTGAEAVAMVAEFQPDVVLMDITIPTLNGIEATRQISAETPDTGVLMVTMLDDNSLFAAIRAGARGYLLKGADGEETLRAIRAVANGEAIFSLAIADRMAEVFAKPPQAEIEPQAPFPELTPREHEILELIAQGKSNAEIAEQFTLSLKTVRNHVSNIFNKLQVSDRLQAVLRAREVGMGRESTNSP
ncbi:MAG: response regulator transcription factor [Anaerolineales bacterium]|nr:response regulator transcription factor [Anaerolineales bacterium]